MKKVEKALLKKIEKPPVVPRVHAASPSPQPQNAEEALFQELEKSLDAPPKRSEDPPPPPPSGFLGKKRLFLCLGGLLLVIFWWFLFQPGSQKKCIDCFLETGRMGPFNDPAGILRVRDLRRERLREVLAGQREFHSWKGVVEYCDLGRKADSALLSVILEKPQWPAWHPALASCTLRTWRNGFADTLDHTLVPRSSPLFDILKKLKKGDRVAISGEFLADEDDFIRIGNVDAAKAFQEPSCIVRFTEVGKL